MKPGAYYNEIDPFAAQWLRNLIAAGHIATGDVDTRSIRDVQLRDLDGYTQCHFFAGIGVWSYALRRAGWPDDRPVWTGSCPCQPFSSAGDGAGLGDERHLWPAWFDLIRARRAQSGAVVVFGEQVASKDGLAWLDLVHHDLEGEGYTVGAVDLCAAGFGAPHIRQRFFFVADTEDALGWSGVARAEAGARAGAQPGWVGSPVGGAARVVADTECGASERFGLEVGGAPRGGSGEGHQRERLRHVAGDGDLAGGVAHPAGARQPCADLGGDSGSAQGGGARRGESERDGDAGLVVDGRVDSLAAGPAAAAGAVGAVGGFWSGADWVWCRDPDGPRWRPVEPGTFPLVAGAPGRVGRLRAYGNAINAEVATGFIQAYVEERGAPRLFGEG